MQLDIYHKAAVLRFLNTPVRLWTSFDMKRFHFLGDRVAATILTNVPEPQLFDPLTVQRILDILKLAFPSRVVDRRLCAMPYLSIYLLRRILARVQDQECRDAIGATLDKLLLIQDEFVARLVADEEQPPPPLGRDAEFDLE